MNKISCNHYSIQNFKPSIQILVGCALAMLTTCILHDFTNFFENIEPLCPALLGAEGLIGLILLLSIENSKSLRPKEIFKKCKSQCREALKKDTPAMIRTCFTHHSISTDIADRINKFFTGTEFDLFYNELADVVDHLTKKDLLSIGTATPTARADRFSSCFTLLQSVGFTHRQDLPLNFWSGKKAQQRANFYNQYNFKSLSDSNVASVRVFITILVEIRKYYGENLTYAHLIQGTFRMFASQASGDIAYFAKIT